MKYFLFSPKKLAIALFPFSIYLSAPTYSADLGNNLKINDSGSIGIGKGDMDQRKLNGNDSISIGTDSQIGYGTNSIAIGTKSNVTSSNSIAIGNNSLAKGTGGISLGDNTKQTGRGIAIGQNASQGKWRKYFPTESVVSTNSGVAIGDSSHAGDVATVALGSRAEANKAFTTAIGTNATAQGKSSTALGADSYSQSWGSVALGLESVASREKGQIGYLAADKMVGNESNLVAKMSSQSQDRLKEIDNKIAEYSKIVNPLANAYYSLSKEYDQKLQEVYDSKLEGKEYNDKINELRTKYQDEVVKRSAALNKTPEYAELKKLQDERAELFSTYVATKGAVSIGNETIMNKNGDVIQRASTRQLTNLAAGSQDTDAVNVAQLKDLQSVMEKEDTALNQKITDNKQAIDNNTTNINKNTNDITQLKENDIQLNNKIEENRKIIDNHSSQIDNNSNAIMENSQHIEKNKNAIIKNSQNIEKNTNEIAKNNQGIDQLKKDTNQKTQDLNNKIENNKEGIISNTKNINYLSEKIRNSYNDVSHLENKIKANEHYIRDVESEMRRGLASQAALNGLFQPYGVGKLNFTAAVGGYNSETAIAVGSGYRINNDVAVKAGIATNTGNFEGVTYNAGVNIEW
ncbi:YadA-like family protein [Proteus mirabilis]|uniref:YadA-like family protein n=1 Tax=Proteus mirabilis TaxID=584 RepID=UPI0013196DEB|nr:YadA-like family protein [Proteus mirabilis]EKT9735220.1 YadA-like family protein [Proteus mirabilis]EKW6744553.1 YadA-like family protein [Proteus mirabilis]MBI6375619.1 YadA-like family protein [Proteus mirabilis]MDM9218207.1 YadA-like family protein [Proteus mirabilis]QHA70700.1 hypothetical protein GO498_10140 [Proteus mirabilis]